MESTSKPIQIQPEYRVSFENMPQLSERRQIMLDLSDASDRYADFRGLSLSQLEEQLVINVD